jgi:hypothetical protein
MKKLRAGNLKNKNIMRTYSVKEYGWIAAAFPPTDGSRYAIPFGLLAKCVCEPPPSKAFTIWMEPSNKSALDERVNEIALAFCSDYPDIEKVGTFEQLYAIESTLEGTNMANDDSRTVLRSYAKDCKGVVIHVLENLYIRR